MWTWKTWLTAWVAAMTWPGGYCTRNAAPSSSAGPAHIFELVGAPSTDFSPWAVDMRQLDRFSQNGAARFAKFYVRQYLNDPSLCFTLVALSQCSITRHVYVYVQPYTHPERSLVVNRLALVIMDAQYKLVNFVHQDELTMAPPLPLNSHRFRLEISKQQALQVALQSLNVASPALSLARSQNQVNTVVDHRSSTWASIRAAALVQGTTMLSVWEVYVRTATSGHSVLVDRYTAAMLAFDAWSYQLNDIPTIAHHLRFQQGASKYRRDLHSKNISRLLSLILPINLRQKPPEFTPLAMTVDEVSKYASDHHFFLVGQEVDMLASKIFHLFHRYGWDQESMGFFDVDWLDVLAANGFAFEPVQGAPLYSKRQENKLDVDIQYGVVATVNLFPGSQRMYGIVPSAPVALATDIHTLLHALFVGTMVKVVGSIQVVKCIGDVDQKDMLTAFGHFFTMLMTPGLHKGYLPFYHFGPQYSGHGLTFYELTWNANPYEASGVFEPRVPRALYDLPRPSTSSWFKMLLMVYGVLMKYFPVSDTWHPEKPLRSANTLMLMIMLTSAKALPCSPTIFDVAKALLEATALLSASEIAEQVCAVLEGLGVVRATV